MNNAQKILVVDDEADIREILSLTLRHEGLDPVEAASAEEALSLLDPSVALILLDVMMDGMSGFEMASKLRGEGNHIPIIFLTAKTGEKDTLTGFGAGADDYIKKPFSTKEVAARVKSVLTRAALPGSLAAEIVHAGPLSIDTTTKSVVIDGESIPLTRTEYDILMLLVKNEGRTVPRLEILNAVWTDQKVVLDRTVDVHIARLRRKLDGYSYVIGNRVGFGYTFRPDKK